MNEVKPRRTAFAMQGWQRRFLILVLLLASWLHIFRLEREGLANLYYAATVRSMLTGWHNFIFASFDPGGFVTVDKPPLGFWVQALSALCFGFRGLSLLLPQVWAGVLAVAVLYRLVGRVFGVGAGLLAGLTLALSPIFVAANRNNTQDALVVLACLLAAYAATRAVESSRLRWLLLSAILLGAGFEIKMLQAYMVLPALFGLYLLAAPTSWLRRVAHLIVATAVLLIVSLAWPVFVDLTPPEQRPYVGSSQDNTVLELIIGHNGMNRLLPGGLRRLVAPQQSPPAGSLPPAAPAAPPVGQPPTGETGAPAALRLFNRQLGGQTSWLLPLAGFGLVAVVWQERLSLRSKRHQALLLWTLWLSPQIIFFSIANLFHRYYLEMLSPAIAALVGVGVVAMWGDYQRPGRRGWLLPVALAVTALVEAVLLREFPPWSARLTPPVLAVSTIAAVVLAVGRLTVLREQNSRATAMAAAIGFLALLIPPTAWALMPVWAGGNAALPTAGPEVLSMPKRLPSLPVQDGLIDFLVASRQGERFLAATINANTAAPLILATAQPVMAMGGFSGSDRIMTLQQLEECVRDGQVRFFLVQSGPGNRPELSRWIENRCQPLPPETWQERRFGPIPRLQVFDCGMLRRR